MEDNQRQSRSGAGTGRVRSLRKQGTLCRREAVAKTTADGERKPGRSKPYHGGYWQAQHATVIALRRERYPSITILQQEQRHHEVVALGEDRHLMALLCHLRYILVGTLQLSLSDFFDQFGRRRLVANLAAS